MSSVVTVTIFVTVGLTSSRIWWFITYGDQEFFCVVMIVSNCTSYCRDDSDVLITSFIRTVLFGGSLFAFLITFMNEVTVSLFLRILQNPHKNGKNILKEIFYF